MPIEVDTAGAPRIVRVTMGPQWPSLEEQRTWRQQMVGRGLMTATTRALIDIRPLQRLPRFEELQDIINAAVRDGGLPLHRAYLTGSLAQFGVARQVQLMSPESITVHVFMEPADAEAWLNG